MKWGIDNGYPDFKSAALVYLEKDILKAVEERSRKSLTDRIKKDKENGVISRSSQSGTSAGENNRSLSTGDRRTAAIDELNKFFQR